MDPIHRLTDDDEATVEALNRFDRSSIMAVIVEVDGQIDVLLCVPPDPQLIATFEMTLARLKEAFLPAQAIEFQKRPS